MLYCQTLVELIGALMPLCTEARHRPMLNYGIWPTTMQRSDARYFQQSVNKALYTTSTKLSISCTKISISHNDYVSAGFGSIAWSCDTEDRRPEVDYANLRPGPRYH